MKQVYSYMLSIFACSIMCFGAQPQPVNPLVGEAQQKVAEAIQDAQNAQEALDTAAIRLTTMQEATQSIQELGLTDPITQDIITTINREFLSRLLTFQTNFLQTINQLQATQDKTAVAMQRITTAQQRMQNQETVQELMPLIAQLNAEKNRIDLIARNMVNYLTQGATQVHFALGNTRQIMKRFYEQPQLADALKRPYYAAYQFVTQLQNIESNIQELISLDMYPEALQAATLAQNVQGLLLPIDAANIQTKLDNIKISASQVSDLIPKEDEEPEEPGEQPTTRRPPQPEPTPAPGPAERPRPAQTVSGKAREAIIKINNKMKSAIHRLDAARSYYKDITKDEQAVVRQKASNILKDNADLSGFATKIKQAKQQLGPELDQDKFKPFEQFLKLHDQLQAKVKSI